MYHPLLYLHFLLSIFPQDIKGLKEEIEKLENPPKRPSDKSDQSTPEKYRETIHEQAQQIQDLRDELNRLREAGLTEENVTSFLAARNGSGPTTPVHQASTAQASMPPTNSVGQASSSGPDDRTDTDGTRTA